MPCSPKINGLQGLTLPKSLSFVIAALYGLKVSIPYIFFITSDFHCVHTKLVMLCWCSPYLVTYVSGSSKIQTLLPCDKLEKNGVKDDAILLV